jgi:hypothetical protein
VYTRSKGKPESVENIFSLAEVLAGFSLDFAMVKKSEDGK